MSYTNKHRRCKFCTYVEHNRIFLPPFVLMDIEAAWCNVRKKCVKLNIPRWFCREYGVKEEV